MGTIELKTEIPGPRSCEWMARRESAIPRGAYHVTPIFVERSEGAVIEDADGNRLIDFAGGLGCLNVGHRHEQVLSKVRAHLDRFLHACFHVTPYDAYVRLAERLNRLTPGSFPKKTLLANSGAEAVENAIKIARAFTRRPAVICFEDAFHGRTMMALSLTSKTHPYKNGFEPFPGEVYRIPFGYCYRCSYSLEFPACGLHCAHRLEDTFKRVVSAESVAAVIVEPVLGEGGFVPAPPEFLNILQQTCRQHGIVFILDEVQTGFGRTGRLFASQYFGIEPDLLVAAKSLGGGLPLAAVTGRAEIMDAPAAGGLGGTFGGNPLSCEAALAVLDAFEDGSLCERAEQIGRQFFERATTWKERFPLVGDVRGVGAMRAIELVSSRQSRTPAEEATKRVVRFCYEHGLVVLSAGTYGNVIRLLVPLVISDDQFDEGLDVLEAALENAGHVSPQT